LSSFEVTRHKHVSRLTLRCRGYEAAESLRFGANESIVTLQQGQLVISLRSTRGHFRPDPRSSKNRTGEEWEEIQEKTVQWDKNQNRTRSSTGQWEAVQESRGSPKAGRVPAQRRHFELEFRSPASLSVWLDQEEESVQLAPKWCNVLSVLSKIVEEADPSDCNLSIVTN
jgi:hypothetical protein